MEALLHASHYCRYSARCCKYRKLPCSMCIPTSLCTTEAARQTVFAKLPCRQGAAVTWVPMSIGARDVWEVALSYARGGSALSAGANRPSEADMAQFPACGMCCQVS